MTTQAGQDASLGVFHHTSESRPLYESLQHLQTLPDESQSQEFQNRPQEHYLTIAMNGIILGATETLTGLPPNSLLMTSL